MTLHLETEDPYGNGLGMTALSRMEALQVALEQCQVGGDVGAIEGPITRSLQWALQHGRPVNARSFHERFRACDARRKELAARRQGDPARTGMEE